MSQIEVKSVSFLTPIFVRLEMDGVETELNLSIDLVNRKVHGDKVTKEIEANILTFIDGKNSLPADFFAMDLDEFEDVPSIDLDLE